MFTLQYKKCKEKKIATFSVTTLPLTPAFLAISFSG